MGHGGGSLCGLTSCLGGYCSFLSYTCLAFYSSLVPKRDITLIGIDPPSIKPVKALSSFNSFHNWFLVNEQQMKYK